MFTVLRNTWALFFGFGIKKKKHFGSVLDVIPFFSSGSDDRKKKYFRKDKNITKKKTGEGHCTHKHPQTSLFFFLLFIIFFFCFLITRVTGIVGQKVWAFVYTQIGPHTVSRPVFVIQPRLVCVYVCVSICYI